MNENPFGGTTGSDVFLTASLDVVAHDVEFGELSIDYLTVGEDNQWR
jgi:hypothetical protein